MQHNLNLISIYQQKQKQKWKSIQNVSMFLLGIWCKLASVTCFRERERERERKRKRERERERERSSGVRKCHLTSMSTTISFSLFSVIKMNLSIHVQIEIIYYISSILYPYFKQSITEREKKGGLKKKQLHPLYISHFRIKETESRAEESRAGKYRGEGRKEMKAIVSTLQYTYRK